MAQQKSGGKLLFYAVISVLLGWGLVSSFSNYSGLLSSLELIGIIAFSVFSLMGLITYVKNGEVFFFFAYGGYILNSILLWYFTESLSLLYLLLAVVGFFSSIPHAQSNKPATLQEGEYPWVKNTAEEVSKVSPETSSSKSAKVTVLEKQPEQTYTNKKTKNQQSPGTHTPGKYVASSKSNVYHEPKCEWAKRIDSNRRVWFAEKADAWEKGYRAHACVQ